MGSLFCIIFVCRPYIGYLAHGYDPMGMYVCRYVNKQTDLPSNLLTPGKSSFGIRVSKFVPVTHVTVREQTNVGWVIR